MSLVVFLFGGIAFFSLQASLLRNLDTTLYNGGKILEDALADYTLKNENDPRSLYEPSEEGDEFLVDVINEEISEIFFESGLVVNW
jgi:hypothetical protein